MPELPEVETIRRTLEKKLPGNHITDVEITWPKAIRSPQPERFLEAVRGKEIKSLSRRGKYLLIHLSENLVLLVHMRMTGRLTYCTPQDPILKHTHVVFKLSNGHELRFSDARKFGRISLVPTPLLKEIPELKNLGPEPLDKSFTRDTLRKSMRRRRSRLKTLLLDQTFLAGLGNIYADEVLHRARLHPERLATNLNQREVGRLYRSIREVLQEAITHRGTTIRDYVDGNGNEGYFQKLLRVYGRENKPCFKCGKPISKVKINGRSTYYCSQCQKLK